MIKEKKLYEEDSELLYLVSERSEEANRTIFEKYKPVIDYYSKKYLGYVEDKGLDYNDLFQEGLIGLDSAINSYKEQKDIKFSTFAFICLKRKIFTAVKNASRKKHSILNDSYSLDYQLENDKNNFSNLVYSSEASIEDLLVSKENLEFFNKRVSEELTNFEKQVYELRINDFSYDEIANTLDKTYKSIESALFRIRIKLKKILNEID